MTSGWKDEFGDTGIIMDPVEAFYVCVNRRAEGEMLAGRPVTGAHHRALEYEIARHRAIKAQQETQHGR